MPSLSVSNVDGPAEDHFDMSTYTDGNMAELMNEDTAAASKHDRAEFMYDFDGAMSVIQETEEPDYDDSTMKTSVACSKMSLARPDSLT